MILSKRKMMREKMVEGMAEEMAEEEKVVEMLDLVWVEFD